MNSSRFLLSLVGLFIVFNVLLGSLNDHTEKITVKFSSDCCHHEESSAPCSDDQGHCHTNCLCYLTLSLLNPSIYLFIPTPATSLSFEQSNQTLPDAPFFGIDYPPLIIS